jgi:hypothetical protein
MAKKIETVDAGTGDVFRDLGFPVQCSAALNQRDAVVRTRNSRRLPPLTSARTAGQVAF